MNEYEELMWRHAELCAAWMERVEADKAAGLGMQFYGTGIRLLKDGSLEMWAREPKTGRPLWVLSMRAGEREVTVS